MHDRENGVIRLRWERVTSEDVKRIFSESHNPAWNRSACARTTCRKSFDSFSTSPTLSKHLTLEPASAPTDSTLYLNTIKVWIENISSDQMRSQRGFIGFRCTSRFLVKIASAREGEPPNFDCTTIVAASS